MPITHLLAIMAQLRDKEKGCPWDVEQDFASIAPCTIEEAYEVVDAIERKDMNDLKEELGDLLLQVVFHAQMAKEAGLFDFDDVVKTVSEKLVRRHPHVFGDASIETSEAQIASWEAIKAEEKRSKQGGLDPAKASLLDDVPVSLPALVRAQKIQKKASKAGFDWPEVGPVFAKLAEEIEELKQAVAGGGESAILNEIGDVLFATVNIANHLKADPDAALRGTIAKFQRRFRAMEHMLAERQAEFRDMSLQQLDELWDQAKLMEQM
jgi:MazG family protein